MRDMTKHKEGVRFIVNMMKQAGYTQIAVDDGDGQWTSYGGCPVDTVDAVMAVDESQIWFLNPETRVSQFAWIILCNGASEIVADCTAGGAIDEISSIWANKCEEEEAE